MRYATRSFALNALFGSCLLLACGDLRAEDRTDGLTLSKVLDEPDVDAAKVADARRLASNVVIEPNLQRAVSTPPATDPVAAELFSLSSVPQSMPLGYHPLGYHPSEDACMTIPHIGGTGGTVLNDNVFILGDGVNISDMAIQWATGPYLHPAPEVVLSFSAGCSDAGVADWKLSSRDVPRSKPSIPHGPLKIELRIDVEPVEFVELMFDGKPLKPTAYGTGSRLSYELPCPAVGQHWLQARYLSGNIWSFDSRALRFEVRLPNQPRIIAVSDFDRDPTPLTRHGVTSITTDSMKVHLANVDRDASIVAYIDGKPVSSHLTEQSCCRIIKVASSIAPGVRKLAVRTVGCPGSCSITSRPSNEIEFHYYDEAVYLLRPGAGCDNKRPDKDCLPTLNSTSGAWRTKRDVPIALNLQESRVVDRPQLSSERGHGQPSSSEAKFAGHDTGRHVTDAPVFRFVSYLQANPAANAKQYAYEADQFAKQAHQLYVAAYNHAVAASTQASSAAKLAKAAQTEFDVATADVQRAKEVASEAAKIHSIVGKMLQRPESVPAIDAAKLAAAEAGKASLIAEQAHKQAKEYAQLAANHATVASRYANAATKPRDQAKTARDQAVQFAKDAQTQATSAKTFESKNLVVEAKRADQQAAVERNRTEAAYRQAESMAKEAEKFEKLATDFKDRANAALADMRSEIAKSKKASEQVVNARWRAQSSHDLAIASNGASITKDAAAAYTSTKKTLDATPSAAAAKNDVRRSQESVDDAKVAVEDADSHLRRAQDYLKEAAAAVNRIKASADKANRESTRANAYADAEATCGDEARARVARDRSNLAAQHAQLASDQVSLAEQNYHHAEAVVSDAQSAVNKARSHFESAKSFRDFAQKEVDGLIAARAGVAQAEEKAREAYNREAHLRNRQDLAGAMQALNDLLTAKGIAEKRSDVVIGHAKQAKQYADWATDRESDARNEARRAEDAAKLARAFTAVANEAARLAAQRASVATSNAQHAGRVLEMDRATERAWDESEQKAAYEAAGARFNTAKAGADESGVKRAHESARAAQTRAAQEWEKGTSRIAEGIANADAARAKKVVGPSSPFVFASAAHFPIREFGLRGELLDREGVVIYEDMTLSFDQEGHYQVRFVLSTPAMPVKLRLQFQIQPYGGPWYTITLPPLDFPPEEDRDGTVRGTLKDHVHNGHSEILRRCYGEMGHDARIRRSGTARIGFGVDVP